MQLFSSVFKKDFKKNFDPEKALKHNEVSNYFELPPSDPFGAIDRKLI